MSVRGMSAEHLTATAEPGGITAETFERYRHLLFAIAYRMLGSVMEAEDVVQDAYLRARTAPTEPVRSEKAYLSTIVTRLCLDRLKSARARRETYVGPWLPEPLLTTEGDPRMTPEYQVDAYDSISMAFLVLLESLTPLERAVFLLREVFDFTYPEIAEIVGRSESACRQHARRAKRFLDERRHRFTSTPEARRRLTDSFLQAVRGGDLEGLMRLLADEITLWADGGGKVTASPRPLHGARNVARFLIGVAERAPAGLHIELTEVNGEPGFIGWLDGSAYVVIVLEGDETRLQAIRIVVNPDKLAHLGPPLPQPL
jgi:RNA polymerase sigma-70 factor (ECF subfamily)